MDQQGLQQIVHDGKNKKPLPDIKEEDLKYVKADYLVDGHNEYVFYIVVIFNAEAGADLASKELQKIDPNMGIEFPEKSEDVTNAQFALRSLLITFKDKKDLPGVYRVCKEIGYDSFMSTYHNQIIIGKANERCEAKNKGIKLNQSVSNMKITTSED